MTPGDEPLDWIAIRGPAVPSWPLPMPASVMRKAMVCVGERGEQTLWLIPGSGAAEGMTPELPRAAVQLRCVDRLPDPLAAARRRVAIFNRADRDGTRRSTPRLSRGDRDPAFRGQPGAASR